MNRRDFIRTTGLTASGLALAGIPIDAFAAKGSNKLTILHTNDIHSRIEAFSSGRNKGLGGFSRRAALINQIRREEKNVLLLDAGDIFQGTPYFNFFGGEIEMKLMSELGYDAATIGNHDFDAGIDGLEKQLVHTNFPLLINNYDFSDTIMNGKTKDVLILQKGKIKVGIFGLGIELTGLVPAELYGNTQYLDPMPIALQTAGRLKHDEKCDFVILLSHLGYKYDSKKISDVTLAEASRDIDLVIGGHTHTFLREPTLAINSEGKRMLINQVGFGGINLGRIDVYFTGDNETRFTKSAVVPVK